MNDLRSPYKHLGDHRQTIPVRVDPKDVAYLRSKFPCGLTGLYDTVLATLFYKFINELRTNEPFEPACFVNDPGYDILQSVLARAFVERCTIGSSDQAEEVSSRNGGRRTRGVYKTVQRASVKRAESKGVSKGGQKTKDSEGAEEK